MKTITDIISNLAHALISVKVTYIVWYVVVDSTEGEGKGTGTSAPLKSELTSLTLKHNKCFGNGQIIITKEL